MQNDHGADQLANSWSDLARTFSHADSNTPASDSSTQLVNTVPRHPSLHDLFANDQDERLIHPLGDHNISLDPASIEVPNFPALPLLTTSTRSNANSAESCSDSAQLTPHENPSAVPLVTWVSKSIAGKGHHELEDELAFARACMLAFKTNATSRTGSYAGLSDFGLGAGKGAISFKQSRKPGVLSESVRRKQLTHLFYTLRSLLPNIAPKHDRCNVIDKTCDYIKSLERELQVLKRKAGILTSVIESNGDPKSNAEDLDTIMTTEISQDANDVRRASSSMSIPCAADEIEKACSNLETPHVQIYLAGDGSINVNIGCYEGKRGLFSALLNIFERRHLEVLNANRSQQGHVVLYAIHLKAQQSSCPLELDIKELKEQLYAEAVATMLL